MSLRFAYFGGEPLGVPVLEALAAAGLTPSLVVTNPDRRAGRKLELTPPPTKAWAEAHGIPVFQPEGKFIEGVSSPLTDTPFDLFVVVAYNKILPEWLLHLPKHQTINLHPSLLPAYRGASPIRTAILEDNRAAVGVTVMLLDAEMDHGPLLAQEPYLVSEEAWPIDGRELDTLLATKGGALLAQTIPQWISGTITPVEQNHAAATYCGRLTKTKGELALDPHNLPQGEAARQVLCTIRGLAGWPGTYFFDQGVRIKINEATLDPAGRLVLSSITPEGKRPQPLATYLANRAEV